VCFYDFDLRLEWLYHSSKEKVFDKLYGFKLLRGTDSCELHSPTEEYLKELTNLLNRKLNLLNFHTHYKAIKKIGKGNFASVKKFSADFRNLLIIFKSIYYFLGIFG